MRGLVERFLGGVLFAVAFPILLVAAVAIWWEDGFPILFRQQRVGQKGILFPALKLRSMRNAVTQGPLITAGGDSRITRTGRFLRAYKLDELPQLWNVFRGEMSFIGPRPEVPKFVDMGDPLWKEVLAVKPGITNASTLLFRDEEKLLRGQADPERYYREILLPEKLQLQVKELTNRSLWNDLRVVAMTAYCSFVPSRFDADSIRRIFLEKSK
jgi:lipopolysaccharide/colanic/teichoic acid biosynthesis glycosyltransferase